MFGPTMMTHILATAEGVRTWIIGFGPMAPIMLVFLQALQVFIAPIPGQPLTLTSGYLYGPWGGMLLNVAGMSLGMLLAMSASRLLGRQLLIRVVGEPVLNRFEHLAHTDSFGTWVLIFLLPAGDVLYHIAGMSRVPLRRLFLAAFVTRTPMTILMTLLGASFAAPRMGTLLLVLAGLVLLTLLVSAGSRRQQLAFKEHTAAS